MRKPNFSKEGMSRFFLYHSEKLILGISLVLLGLFFYMGFSSQPGVDTTPTQLKQTSDQANQYINQPNWGIVVPFRKTEPLAADAPKVETGDYLFGVISGVKCPTMEARTDPNLLPPTELLARSIVAPVLLSPPRGVDLKVDPISRLPLAASNMGIGLEGEFGQAFDDFGEFDEGVGGRPPRRPKTPKVTEAEVPKIDAGDRLLPIHTYHMLGLQPQKYNFRPETEKSFVMNVVVVAGLVNIQQQAAEYEKSFASSVGFFPERDRPEYQYFQVQRRENTYTDWSDITDAVTLSQPAFHPTALPKMPGALFTSAPEYISPDFYDPMLTSPIPPISRVDYRSYVTHPKIENRKFDALFGNDGDVSGARLRPDFEQFENPRGVRPGRPGPGGMARPGVRGMRQDFGDGGALEEELPPVRLGSDVTNYERALIYPNPAAQYKLFRFFDLAAKPGKTYQYRMRIWLNDPNHEPTEEELKKVGDQGLATADERTGTDRSAMLARGQRAGLDFANRGQNPDDEFGLNPDSDEIYQKITITNKMKDIKVRNRLLQSRSVPDPKDRRRSEFYITEFYSDDQGAEVKEEILIPKSRPDLQFSRPTPWSAVVEVTVKAPASEVLAGGIRPARTTRVANVELPEGEPTAEVVPVVWSPKYGTELSVRKQALRADSLDYNANIHILNSVTWDVHVFDNAPIISKTVVVDMMGGEELTLPKEELMRHNLPAEILVMNEDGSFHVSNDMNDKGRLKRTLFLPDDTASVGGDRALRDRQKRMEEEQKKGGGFGF